MIEVTANSLTNQVSVLLGNGDSTFQSAINLPIDTGLGTISVVAADVNKDEWLDLAATNINSNNVSILLGKGDGTFEESAINFPVGNSPVSVVAADVNKDEWLDLATANVNSKNVSILPLLR